MATAMPGNDSTKRLLQHRLKIRHLLLLTTIAEHRSLSKAAALLNITQSATTKTLRELEDTLGVSLFNRTPRGVTPTVYGQSLIQHAKTILSEVHFAADEITDLKAGSAGRIVVGILRAAAAALLPATFVQLRERYPAISMTVVEGTYETLTPGLHAGEIDLLVGYMPATRPRQDLVQERLYLDAAAVVVRRGHPLRAQRKRISLADLSDRQWILPIENTVLRLHIDAAFRAAGREPPLCPIESNASLLIQSLLPQSDLVAALPYQIASQLEKFGLLAILPIRIAGTGLPVGITTCAKRPLKPAARTLLEVLRKVAKAESVKIRTWYEALTETPPGPDKADARGKRARKPHARRAV